MSKPSIFSKDYAKEMKRRKRNIFLLIIVPIIGLTIFLTTGFNGLLSKGISIKNSILLNKSKDDTKDEKSKVAEAPKKIEESIKPQPGAEAPKVTQEAVTNNEIFPISLSDGQKINIEYTISGTEKTIKGVSVGSNISYDISPSKKAVVIQSVRNQDMIYLDSNRVSKDITRKVHTSTKGQVFSKDQQLEKHPNYVWSITPKFIDEDNIAYVSELPWINENAVQFIWKVNLKDNTHIQAKPASGKSITFKNIDPKGLGTVVDGNEVFVTSMGEVIQ
ncbi:tRNA (guanine-N1)-methyltransferase [Clostridium sp. CS001]|uniref:tRNA (guanine-N1)-methyltransferase n=1 Tax=Clostridium sp. CS001 TaxID=2880648 RepID=UPI001CF2F15B|nr:tRNA (guanine-N1)-methyltransferase [Clostridium sp. CS001]MCB2290732.1 tRNA (guanine-N1)-methyltransferase [Clostridium sp. CS001]